MINIELTEDEKDCLQELMNVAYGSATAAITEIFDAFAKLSIPTIKIINAVDLKDYLAKELNFKDEHFIASQQINGPLNGENMFIIDKKSATNMSIKFGFSDDEISNEDISDITLEITNILSSSTISKLAEDIETSVSFSAPTIKTINSINQLNNIFISNYEKVIIISTKLEFDDLNIHGELFILTTDNSILFIKEKLNKILDELWAIQKKNKFDIICNTVDNGIIVLDKDLRVLFWNRWLETRTGLEASNIINKNILDFYSNIDEKKLKRKITTALKLNSPTFYTPQTDNFLINIEINNISDRVFNQMQQSITITPLDLEESLVILYIYDITFLSETNYKLEMAKKNLSEKNEELRLILDTTMEAIIIFKDNSVVDCNKIAIELFNKQMKYELINKSFDDLINNKNSDIFNEKEPFETNLTREDGSEFSAIINIKNTSLNNQIFQIVTIANIEDLKRKENLMAEQSKLAAMGEMLGNIAHQWRQPLNIISMSSSNLKLKNDMGELNSSTLRESLSLILKTINHLSDTIETFNDFLKTDKEKSIFNVNDNIKNSISLVDNFFKNFNIDIVLELDDDVFLNNLANEFSQAFINILNNAKDAIVLNLKDNESGLIKIKTKKIDNFIEILVLDNALGVDKDILNKIFEPYFTTKHKYQGTGLGLYMTRKIINSSMGGEISVQNKKFTHNKKEYKGAEFKIKIPLKLDWLWLKVCDIILSYNLKFLIK